MKTLIVKNMKLAIAFAGALFLSACATGPDIAEMEALNGEQAEQLLAGNTLTFKADYGRWAEYFDSNSLAGRGKAWGTWGEELADSVTNISTEGEVCTQYSGEHEWSTPEHEFCFLVYTGSEGQVVLQGTQNTYKPERVGKIRKVEIEAGDSYGLMN